jgi:inner membrane transporter RhtA
MHRGPARVLSWHPLQATLMRPPGRSHSQASAFGHPLLVLAGIGVGISSSVIPYITDQLALARLRRATYALMVSLLPAIATIIGVLVLAQVPTAIQIAGVTFVVAGVATHQQAPAATGP